MTKRGGLGWTCTRTCAAAPVTGLEGRLRLAFLGCWGSIKRDEAVGGR